jgi:SOS-response transcriptional repressor LexA
MNDLYRMINYLVNCKELDIKFRLYILLVTYCKNKNGTSAFNSHFMDKLNIKSPRSIEKALKWLKNAELIDISIVRGNKRVITLRNDSNLPNLEKFVFDYNWFDEK